MAPPDSVKRGKCLHATLTVPRATKTDPVKIWMLVLLNLQGQPLGVSLKARPGTPKTVSKGEGRVMRSRLKECGTFLH